MVDYNYICSVSYNFNTLWKKKMIINVSVDVLKKHWSPFNSRTRPWSLRDKAISEKDVKQAVSQGELVSCGREEHFKYYGDDLRGLHIKRIAWFVVHGVESPISIYICPFLKESNGSYPWIVSDGNHRLAASIVRGDEIIKSNIRGDIDNAEKLLHLDFGSPDGMP